MRDEEDPDLQVRGGEPEPLAGLLAAQASRRDWQRRLDGARVHERWKEIAGETLAEHVTPVRLLGGVLVVRVSGPSWAAQLRWLEPQLVARANDVLGTGSVTTVRAAGPKRPARPRPPPPTGR